MRQIALTHAVFSVSLFVLYLVLSMIYSPQFLAKDLQSKFKALADDTVTITGRVLGPPEKPVVTGSAFCNTSTGQLSVNLDWADDDGTQTFSIDRDALPLVAGLTQSQYSDTNVAVGTTYQYIVTAYGEMSPGFAVSDPVDIITPDECNIVLPAAEIQVTDFNGNGLRTGSSGYPETTSKQPTFSGTTNIPNADITAMISLSDLVINANFTANINGYWTWQPPVAVSTGQHALILTVADPNDATRTATTSFTFVIKSSKGGGDDDDGKKSAEEEAAVPTITPETPAGIPLGFLLSIKDDSVLQGQSLETTVEINRLDPKYEGRPARIHYVMLDAEGNEIGSVDQDVILHLGAKFDNRIPIAKYAAIGPYRLRAELIYGKYNLSQEKNFEILPVPILKYGGGIVTTCPELLSQVGTISIWLLIALIVWLTLFWREYLKHFRALRQVTENNLADLGLIRRKKGKGVPR
jgi:hypothetical protein